MRALKLFTLAFVVATFVQAADIRIGFVDLQKVLTSVDAGKKAKSLLEKEMSAKRTSLEKEQKEIQTELEQLEKRSAILNETAKMKKQAELQKKLQAFQRKAMESQMALQKREQELTKPLLDEVRVIVESVGKSKGFQLILEKSEGAVLYAAQGADLTSDVIAAFNKKK